MIGKIEHDICRRVYPEFPWVNNRTDNFYFPKVHQSHLLCISSKSAKGHAGNLSRELDKLFRHIDIDHLIFLGEYKRPWRFQDSSYPPVQAALAYLKERKVSKRFNGALDVPRGEWQIFFKHLFWLVRCNAALPIFYFMDSRRTLLGSFCQYGNIHLHSLTIEGEEGIIQALGITVFEDRIGERCYSSFSKTSRISNRTTLLP